MFKNLETIPSSLESVSQSEVESHVTLDTHIYRIKHKYNAGPLFVIT